MDALPYVLTAALFIVFIVAASSYAAHLRARLARSINHADALGFKLTELEAQTKALGAQVERKTERIRDLLFDLEKARAAASAPLPPKPEPLDAEDFRAAFDVEPATPLWQAVHQLLDAAIVKGVETVEVAPSMSYGAENRTHAAGELSALRDLQKDLLRWHREARQAKVEA